MTPCGQIRSRLEAWRDGHLLLAESQALEAHLEACPDCAAWLEASRPEDAWIRRLPPAPSAGLLLRISSPASSSRRPLLHAAAAAMLLILAGILWHHGRAVDPLEGIRLVEEPGTRMLVQKTPGGHVVMLKLDSGKLSCNAARRPDTHLRVVTPAGIVEARGAAFRVSVHADPQEEQMNKPAMLGSAAVAVVAVAGLVHFIDLDGKDHPVPAPAAALAQPGKPVQVVDPEVYAKTARDLEQATARLASLKEALVRARALTASAPENTSPTPTENQALQPEGPSESLALELGPEGPKLGKGMAQTLDLQPAQVQAIDNILQATYRDYLAFVARHLEKSRDEKGHLHITIQAFTEDGDFIKQRFVSQIAGCLNLRQRMVAERHLYPLMEDLSLKFGQVKNDFEMWKEKQKEETLWCVRHSQFTPIANDEIGMGLMMVRTKDEIPSHYRRFVEEYWEESP